MDTVQHQMQEASRLIRAQRYQEARQLLRTVAHPKATEWLLQLDQIAPEPRRRWWSAGRIAVVALLVLALAVFVMAYALPTARFQIEYAAARAECDRWSQTRSQASDCILEWFEQRQ